MHLDTVCEAEQPHRDGDGRSATPRLLFHSLGERHEDTDVDADGAEERRRAAAGGVPRDTGYSSSKVRRDFCRSESERYPMVDWERVKSDLADAGYPEFQVATTDERVAGASGCVVGDVIREGSLERSNMPLLWRFIDSIPFGPTLPIDPTYAPSSLRRVADAHGLDIVIISGGKNWVRIALCDT